MTSLRLYIIQRATALVMIPFILAHIAVIFYAVSGGLSAEDILMRTRGSIGWGAFYAVFVLLASTHGAIGLRSILLEWTPLGESAADILAIAFTVVLVMLGLRAVAAVVIA
ncbi:MAG: succinate dehydrogenase [Hyphomicrobiaceae bacterium]